MPEPTPPTDDKTGLQKALDMAAGTKEAPSSWPVAMAFLGLFVLILAVLGVKMALGRRAAAETARKLREQIEAERQAREAEKLADNASARLEAREVIEDAKAQIGALKQDMEIRQALHEEYVKELQSVTSWDDIVVVDRRTP